MIGKILIFYSFLKKLNDVHVIPHRQPIAIEKRYDFGEVKVMNLTLYELPEDISKDWRKLVKALKEGKNFMNIDFIARSQYVKWKCITSLSPYGVL